MTFEVTAMDKAGGRRTFRRDAESSSALSAQLRSEGFVVVSVEEVSQPAAATEDSAPDMRSRWSPSWLLPMTGFDVEMGLRQIASMIRSGVTLLAALRTAADQSPSPRSARAWRRVSDRVFSGDSFASALEGQKRRFGEVTVRLAEVGERSGELENALVRAAEQMEARRTLRTAVVNALVYPVIAVTMAVAVSAYLVCVVIPKLAEFLKSGGAELPYITQLLMDFSAWVNANGLYVLVWTTVAVAAWFLVRLYPPGREAEDVMLMRVPVTGRILRLSGTALFSRSMQIMTESGVTLLDALQTSARIMSNRRLRGRIVSAREEVMRGATLASALAPAVEFMPMMRRMAAVGETTGALPEAFGETARFHEMLLALAVKRFGMMIEPVMIVITGGIVGFVYIAFFMALFAIAGAA